MCVVQDGDGVAIGQSAMGEKFTKTYLLLTVERMLSMVPKMTEDEKAALSAWEAVNLGSGGKGTTDWPGWMSVVSRLSH